MCKCNILCMYVNVYCFILRLCLCLMLLLVEKLFFLLFFWGYFNFLFCNYCCLLTILIVKNVMPAGAVESKPNHFREGVQYVYIPETKYAKFVVTSSIYQLEKARNQIDLYMNEIGLNIRDAFRVLEWYKFNRRRWIDYYSYHDFHWVTVTFSFSI